MRANLATLALTIVLILAVFIIDVFLPVEIAAGVGYVLAVAVAFGANVPGFPIGVACTCSVQLPPVEPSEQFLICLTLASRVVASKPEFSCSWHFSGGEPGGHPFCWEKVAVPL